MAATRQAADATIDSSLELLQSLGKVADVEKLKDTLKLMFIVSKCELTDETDGLEEFETSYIKVEKFNGHTCARCWAVFDEDEMHDEELCERCFDVVNG